MGRRRLAAFLVLAAALSASGPASAGDWLGIAAWARHGLPRHATHPTVRGVMAMQSPSRAVPAEGGRARGHWGIRPFGSVQTGMESGIGYGYPTLYARPGQGAVRWHPWR